MSGRGARTRGPGGGAPDRDLPAWFLELLGSLEGLSAVDLARLSPPPDAPLRQGAVLVLFAEGPAGPDILLTQRAADMRSHPGQPAFPGGSIDPADDGPIDAALREAQEETGLDPAGVHVVRTLPELYLPPSGFAVTPVLGYWVRPVPVWAADPREVAKAERVPVRDLVDPAHRVTVRHPSGFRGPGFEVAGMLVWGFTALLLDRLLEVAGWAVPWAPGREAEVPW
jgi:8-oxo-dGTP pyrophosphatase MutT (NUDIX family)